MSNRHHGDIDVVELHHPALVERIVEHLIVAYAIVLRLLDAPDHASIARDLYRD
jgi:hypothetical protein